MAARFGSGNFLCGKILVIRGQRRKRGVARASDWSLTLTNAKYDGTIGFRVQLTLKLLDVFLSRYHRTV